MWGIPFCIFNPVACAQEILTKVEETKMKKLIIENQVTDVYSVDALKKLDERIETCDWVAAYITSSGLIARLCSYKPTGHNWRVGFKYINPSSHGQRSQCYFEAWNHAEAIKNAIRSDRTVMLFNNEAEFINWTKDNMKWS